MTVHEVSKLAGVSIRTLQYYDKIGLFHPTGYTDAGYRLYDDADLERLQHILLFRELEFPLKDIKAIINSPDFDISKTDHRSLLTACIQARVMQIDGIKKMLSFETEYNDTDRTLEVSFMVNTVDGQEIAYTTKLSV